MNDQKSQHEAARDWWEGLDDSVRVMIAGAAAVFVGIVIIILGATNSAGPGKTFPTDPTVSTEPANPTTEPSTPTTEPSTNPRLDALDNPAGLRLSDGGFTQGDLDELAFSGRDPFTSPISPRTNGRSPQGQFRIQCLPSHFSVEDPVIFPGLPNAGHLHMFFGNVETDAYSTPESLLASGASTCQGGELNRSAYWMPAMVDGDGAIVTPEAITLYYKSHRPEDVSGVYPHGLQMVAGLRADGRVNETFRASERLSWGCYNGSSTTAIRNTIPGTVSAPCPSGQPIQATVQFPQCIAVEDGEPVTTSGDLVSHTAMLFDVNGNYGRQGDPCPPSHPYRVPQVSYLVRWPTVDASTGESLDVSGWKLSSDEMHGAEPGGTLHADWVGAWHLDSNRVWLDGCFNPTSPSNCSLGQTGAPRGFARIIGDSVVNMVYTGPTRLEVE